MKMIDKAKSRFADEVQQIDAYINYMQENFYLRYKDLCFIDGIEILDRLVEDYVFTCNSPSQHTTNYRRLKKISKTIEELHQNYLHRYENSTKAIVPKMTKRVRKLINEYKFGDYIQTPYMSSDGLYHEYIRSQDAAQIKTGIDSTLGSAQYYAEFSESDYKRALQILEASAYNDSIEELERCLQWLSDFRIHFKLYDMRNPINIYRQSFISLMAIFDATIFDVAQEVFADDFFVSLPLINPKGKIEVSSISVYGSFTVLKEKEIESCLGKKYIAEVLGILHSYKNTLFYFDNTDWLSDILEMVSRRNIHVHNKGIVDQKYFEKGNGAIKYSIRLGQFAAIDSSYYFHVSDILKKFIAHLQ